MTYEQIRLIAPSFNSPLIEKIISLNHLRKESFRLQGSTPPVFFFQIRDIFQWMESVGSARIEGNHTTISEYVDIRMSRKKAPSAQEEKQARIREIENIQDAMKYIEETVAEKENITHQLIREVHSIAVKNLPSPAEGGEGDPNPGGYRTADVAISGAEHVPPKHIMVQTLMDELLDFINTEDSSKHDLLKIALAHHRFCWIHPFRNGNGRVVRLLTYAMLIKFGFSVKNGILNPTSVFCINRENYYEKLAHADLGTNEALEEWCLYVLSGVETQLEKLHRLTDNEYTRKKILIPALEYSLEKAVISPTQFNILKACIHSPDGTLVASDIEKFEPNLNARQRTYQISKLVEEGLLENIRPNSRKYTVKLAESSLVRGVLKSLYDEGYSGGLENTQSN